MYAVRIIYLLFIIRLITIKKIKKVCKCFCTPDYGKNSNCMIYVIYSLLHDLSCRTIAHADDVDAARVGIDAHTCCVVVLKFCGI